MLTPVRMSIGLWCASAILFAQNSQVSFDDQVLPILTKNCLGCHGQSQQMAGYDLRTRETAIRGGSKGTAIVPGDGASSAMVKRLTGVEQPAMPLGAKLVEADIATI